LVLKDVNQLVFHISQFSRLGAEKLRSELLPLTFDNALRTEFYRSFWKGIDTEKISLSMLSALPLVSRENIVQAKQLAQVREELVCDEVLTLGTTGNPFVTVKGDWEQKFIEAFFEARRDTRDYQKRKRVLKFNDPYHGYHVKIPNDFHCHRMGIYDSGGFDYGREVLQRAHLETMVESRCSLLVGLEPFLRAFTIDTAEKYPEGFDSALEAVISSGNFITKKWRSQMEYIWRVPVIDTFSMSEVFGSATQSLVCGWYHFDTYVIPEVVSSQTLHPIKEGTGILVLTSLYPFQEAQPLIRYVTEDLVEVTHTLSSKPGELAIKPLGRAKFGVPLPNSDEWLLTPVSVWEVLDDLPEVARKPKFQDAKQVRDPELTGSPLYSLSWSKSDKDIQINLLVFLKGEAKSSQISYLEQRILKNLRQINGPLAYRMDSGMVHLRVQFNANLDSTDNILDIWM
jgi:phenylacetate-coenzyme A ligase PaaK-like adenylate-forming protein